MRRIVVPFAALRRPLRPTFESTMIRALAFCLVLLTSGCSAIVRHDYFRPENERALHLEGSCHEFLGGPRAGLSKQITGAPPIATVEMESATLGFCSHLERERILALGPLVPFIPFTIGAGPAEPRVEVAVRVVTSAELDTLDLSSAKLFTAAGEPRALLDYSSSFWGCERNASTPDVGPEGNRRVSLTRGQFVWLCFARSDPTKDDEYFLHLESVAVGNVSQSPIKLRLRKHRGTFYVITG